MLCNVILMIVFLYLVCIGDAYVYSKKQHKQKNTKEPFLETFLENMTSSHLLYLSVILPPMSFVLLLAFIIELFVLYY